MDFFNKIFDGLVDLSEKLPTIEIGSFCIVVAAALGIVAVVIGLTYLASEAYKLRRACGRVISYLDSEEVVNDDNVADFTAYCFGTKAPAALREAWVSYLGVRFGYPSEVLSESAVFDKEVKRPDPVRANVFIAIALVLTAVFAFWGLGAMKTSEVGVVLLLGLLIGGVGYLALWLIARKEYIDAKRKFALMQEELDSKVDLQSERDYATDASPLLQVAAIMDGIIARNIARPAPTKEELEAVVREREREEEPLPVKEEPAPEKEEPSPESEESVIESLPAEERVFETLPEEEHIETYAPEEEKTPIEQAVEEAERAEESAPLPEEEAQEETEEARGENAEDIEINDEDEEIMFGRKKKKLQNAELTARGYDDLVVDAEVLDDDNGDGAEVGQLVSMPAPAQPYAQQPAPAQATSVQPAPAGMARGSAPESLEGLNIAARPAADSSVTVSLEPEVIYVEEDLDEGDEDVKPPRLAKLPHLVDYVLTMNLSRSMKIRVAMLMLQAYSVFQNSPENKAIVIQCLTKIMRVLMADHAAAQAAKAKAEKEAAEAQAAADKAAE